MKKLLLGVLSITAVTVLYGQKKDSTRSRTNLNRIDLSNRANDHFMLQFGYDGWLNTPDSINPSGFSRHFNFYFMYDKPFKANPHLSVGIGAGLGTSNIFFKNTYIDIKSQTTTLPFMNVSGATINHFDKYKFTTVFFEAPVELRLAANPVTPDKGFKAALGIKVGTLLKAYTKGKNMLDASGKTMYGDRYIRKEQEKKFMNTTRFAVTGRVGFGNFTLDGSYQLTSFLKDGAGPTIHPYSIGLTLSGL